MKKIWGITLGGLQQKIINLLLIFMLILIGTGVALSYHRSTTLSQLFVETEARQQQAIAQISTDTMHQVTEIASRRSNALQAYIATDMFDFIRNDVQILQSQATVLFRERSLFTPIMPSPPDPSQDGAYSVQVLTEEGVDYTQSSDVGIATLMRTTMIALLQSSDKVSNCYFGLEDGVTLCADTIASDKFDENGNVYAFAARERDWYTGAVKAGGIYFTGVMKDRFTGKLCVSCSAPVYEGDRLVGVVGADLFMDAISNYVDTYSTADGFICLINAQGQVIFAPADNGLFTVRLSEDAEDLRSSPNEALAAFITDALREQTDLRLVTVNDQKYYMIGSPVPAVGWTVLTVIHEEATEQSTRAMLSQYTEINRKAQANYATGNDAGNRLLLILVAALVVLGIIAALILANRIVKPVEAMTREIIDGGQTGKLFEMKPIYKTNDEIEVLAESFDDLSHKIRDYVTDITRITQEKERIGTELGLARKIQGDMLPQIFPAFPDRQEFDIYATMTPAKEVGGDFYDFFLLDSDHLGMVVADVSGKGVPAALFMMISKILVQNYAQSGRSPHEVLEKVNQQICQNNREEMFVTVWLGILDLKTGRLTASNAGHEYPILRQPGGQFEIVKDRHGFVIGGIDGVHYTNYELQLQRGARLFVYSDGVPEATNNDNEFYGLDRLIDALNENTEATPHEILGNVRRSLDTFVGTAAPFDDVTMLCVEYTGPKNPVKEITVPATVESIATVTDFINAELEAVDCPMKAQMQIDVAIDELFGNIAHYAYPGAVGQATVRFEALDDPRAAQITFIDSGIAYNPLKAAEPDVTLAAEDRQIGGLGIFLVRKTMDEVGYELVDGQNILRIKKLF